MKDIKIKGRWQNNLENSNFIFSSLIFVFDFWFLIFGFYF